MITKELLKSEIDNVNDAFIEVLYRIIKMLESPAGQLPAHIHSEGNGQDWTQFIQETYGCLANDPIHRDDQGEYEIREDFK